MVCDADATHEPGPSARRGCVQARPAFSSAVPQVSTISRVTTYGSTFAFGRRSSMIDFMRRGITGHGEPERTGPDQENAALVRQLIGDALAQLSGGHRAVIRRSHHLGWTTEQVDDLQMAENTLKSRLHLALRALRLTRQRPPTRAHSTPRACDVDRPGAGPHSLPLATFGKDDLRRKPGLAAS
jgi:hypothetical protein